MMSKYGARMLFIVGTIICTVVFLWLTLDTLSQVKTRTKEENLTAQVIEGKKTWQKYNCNDCHTILGIGAYYAPDVTKVASYRDADWLRRFFRDSSAVGPASRKMPNQKLTETEIDNLIAFLQWVNEIDTNNWPPQPLGSAASAEQPGQVQPAESSTSQSSLTPPSVQNKSGIQLYRTKGCAQCHIINGLGGTAGPDLSRIASKQNEEYLERFLSDPAKTKPGTKMPNPKLNETEIETIVDYLETLK
ncbi:MAG: c-type cytochrome [bacterium]|nr:c-type cytochrome [bacterium]